jgi:chitodextrinase
MAYRFPVALGGAALTVTLLLAGGVGAAGAAPGTPAPTPTPPITCPPILPISAAVSAVTPTSVTISYSIFLAPPCGYDPPVTVTLFADHDDAQQWVDPVGEAVSGPERSGPVTITGLTPDTLYWFRFTAGGHRDPYVFASVRTAPVPVCTATVKIDSEWSGGWVATISVRNVDVEPLTGWHVSWRWPGDERVQALWNATTSGSGPDVTVTDAGYNGSVPPGGTTTFGLLVTATGPPATITPTCTR